MFKKKKLIYILALIPVIIILFMFGWFFAVIFEGEKPQIKIQAAPTFLSRKQTLHFKISDKKRGLKRVKIFLDQEGREIRLTEKKFPFEGLLNRQGVHQHGLAVSVDPAQLHLAQGRVNLNVHVWDYSRRGGGDGNLTLIQHKMIVDTIPPSIRAVSRMHNINMGGTGLVVYQASSDTQESGVYVDKTFFPGYVADKTKGLYTCYFGIPYDAGPKVPIYLWARDEAENVSKTTFYYHIRKKRFRKDRINVTDRFLGKILPYFSDYLGNSGESDVQKYVRINRQLREENHKTLVGLARKTSPDRLWEGRFSRLKNSAPMARFADRRTYYHNKKAIDEQVHLGVDLASLASSPVGAANHARVLHAGPLGIYGGTVVLDHGQGLLSVYGHLSKVAVNIDQKVRKGDVIGYTGQTGLAGGDHLHFSIMVNGMFVNPIEWWDNHWIRDNITKKLVLLK
ncbi:MAG: M23 family metallopeptidase [Deltaproteobacteria bacterium]|nr:M23 family metallopeptidase [Deltaproteobacteria bacterium]